MALTDNLIAYWNLQEASGNAIDAVDASEDLTDTNTVTQAAGPSATVPQSRQYTRANSEKHTKADNAALSLNGTSWTFTGWVRLDTLTAGQFYGIVNKRTNNTPAEQEYIIYIGGTAQKITVSSSDGTTISNATEPTLLSTATWYFFAGEYDSATSKLRVSLNGGAWTEATGVNSTRDGTSSFDIGWVQDVHYMNGRITAVGLWKRALSDAEISQLYNGGSGLLYPFPSGQSQAPRTMHQMRMRRAA